MNNKQLIVAGILILGLFGYVSFTLSQAPAPIVDEACIAGYELVGEGCIPLKEACELRGEGYKFDEATQTCLAQ